MGNNISRVRRKTIELGLKNRSAHMSTGPESGARTLSTSPSPVGVTAHEDKKQEIESMLEAKTPSQDTNLKQISEGGRLLHWAEKTGADACCVEHSKSNPAGEPYTQQEPKSRETSGALDVLP
jgi:hypothetical protein